MKKGIAKIFSCFRVCEASLFQMNEQGKRICSLIIMYMCCSVWLYAQQNAMMISAPSKEAKKEAKNMMKSGWKTVEDRLSMESQIEKSYFLQSVLMDDGEGQSTPRYILATAEAKDKNHEIAQTKARAFCEAQIVQSLQSVITSLVERDVKTRQTSSTEAQTKEEIQQRTEMMSKSCLQDCSVVCLFMKENADGSTSIQMTLSLDKTKIAIKN